MRPTGIPGVFRENNKLFTENLESCRGIQVYNEKLVSINDKELRSWNPYRSKLAAAILKGLKNINITSKSEILYLGAATGTTVSHISDIVKDGAVYSVENSPVALKQLIKLSRKRHNIIPIMADASHPEKYSHIVPHVDFIYQDISQRNQADIFIKNVDRYLKKAGYGIMMVKARSIDVSLKPKDAYDMVINKLIEHKVKIIKTIDLAPYEKDHVSIMISL
ncbi:MAG: fibrillarin-like rRNA/tRNA 2'-O-methyltransferase [Thermoplasmata archaeon]|nr:MAG: fibrillarin-like rRNA/tRNA 2'-O-methyltransferase [Thermoplasmata archaeon]RLF35665.1 MAG: fibrillarin-like rRNA/tRNA 2'-O-methyltransferase [Thermoplasmata archaeon]